MENLIQDHFPLYLSRNFPILSFLFFRDKRLMKVNMGSQFRSTHAFLFHFASSILSHFSHVIDSIRTHQKADKSVFLATHLRIGNRIRDDLQVIKIYDALLRLFSESQTFCRSFLAVKLHQQPPICFSITIRKMLEYNLHCD